MYQLTEMPKSTLNLFLSVATCRVITSLLFTDETPNVCIAPWERSFVFECSLWYELVNGIINVCFKLIPISSDRLCFRTGCLELLKALL